MAVSSTVIFSGSFSMKAHVIIGFRELDKSDYLEIIHAPNSWIIHWLLWWVKWTTCLHSNSKSLEYGCVSEQIDLS